MFCSNCGAALAHAAPVQCPACGTEHWRNAKPGTGGLVTHDGKLLLVRRANEPFLGYWDIPGGFCDVTEHPAETAEREVFEETGLRVRATGFLGMWLDTYGEGQLEVTLNIFYHCVLLDSPDAARVTEEASEIGWFAPDALPDAIAFPTHARLALAAWREAFEQGRTATLMPDRP